jgi:hypothetical protein
LEGTERKLLPWVGLKQMELGEAEMEPGEAGMELVQQDEHANG